MKITLHEISMAHKNKNTANKDNKVSSKIIFQLNSCNLVEGECKVKKRNPKNNLDKSIWTMKEYEGTILITRFYP